MKLNAFFWLLIHIIQINAWNVVHTKKTDFRIFKSLIACYKWEDNGCQTRQITLRWKMFKIAPWVVQMKADGQWPV